MSLKSHLHAVRGGNGGCPPALPDRMVSEQGHPVVLKGSTGMSGNQDEQARGMALIAAIMLSAILFFGYLNWSAAR